MLKKQLRTRLKGSHSLQVLPPTPDLLRLSHKAMYDDLYHNELPAKCPFPPNHITTIEGNTKCRDHAKKYSSSSQRETINLSNPENTGALQAFGNMMVASMREMAQMQKSMFLHMAGRGSPLTIDMPRAKAKPLPIVNFPANRGDAMSGAAPLSDVRRLECEQQDSDKQQGSDKEQEQEPAGKPHEEKQLEDPGYKTGIKRMNASDCLEEVLRATRARTTEPEAETRGEHVLPKPGKAVKAAPKPCTVVLPKPGKAVSKKPSSFSVE